MQRVILWIGSDVSFFFAKKAFVFVSELIALENKVSVNRLQRVWIVCQNKCRIKIKLSLGRKQSCIATFGTATPRTDLLRLVEHRQAVNFQRKFYLLFIYLFYVSIYAQTERERKTLSCLTSSDSPRTDVRFPWEKYAAGKIQENNNRAALAFFLGI